MSTRVEPTDVELVVPGIAFDTHVLEAAITDASTWVDQYLAGRLSDDTLASIEKYLAAHLAVNAAHGGTGQVVQEQVDDTSERRESVMGRDGVSMYLRIAAAFDPTGRVRHYWMGEPLMRWRVGRGYAIRGGGPS